MPISTRYVRVRLIATSRLGNAIDSYFDNLSLTAGIKQNQTITFNPLSSKNFGDTAFQLTTTASSKLPVKFTVVSDPASIDSNNYITIKGAGAITIEADQPGDNTYYAATSVQQSLTVTKALRNVTFNATLDSASTITHYLLSATSTSGLPVRFVVQSGFGATLADTLTFTGAGPVVVRAIQDGNQNYGSTYEEKTYCVASAAPGQINGYTNVCKSINSYNVTAFPGALYKWSVSGGGNLSATSGNAINVTWNALGTYIVTVTAYSSCDTVNKHSSSITVNVVDNITLAPTSNLFPLNGTIIQSFPVTFSWMSVSNASLYDLYIWPDGNTQPSTPTISNINGISYTVGPGNLSGFTGGKTYIKLIDEKNTSSRLDSFGFGSFKSEVLRIQGNPYQISYEYNLERWNYLCGSVWFRENKVEIIGNDSNKLKAKHH